MNDTPRHRIDIQVRTAYLEGQSYPTRCQYVFAYTVRLHNSGQVPARLLSRHWIITDGHGRVQNVRGEGVVGEQPYLRPGEGFEYTSGTRLDTPVGSMHGSYQMQADDGVAFDADIPPFVLAVPGALN